MTYTREQFDQFAAGIAPHLACLPMPDAAFALDVVADNAAAATSNQLGRHTVRAFAISLGRDYHGSEAALDGLPLDAEARAVTICKLMQGVDVGPHRDDAGWAATAAAWLAGRNPVEENNQRHAAMAEHLRSTAERDLAERAERSAAREREIAAENRARGIRRFDEDRAAEIKKPGEYEREYQEWRTA
jgi:hypothetical protein